MEQVSITMLGLNCEILSWFDFSKQTEVKFAFIAHGGAVFWKLYRGTSLVRIRKHPPLTPYRRPRPRVRRVVLGGCVFSYGRGTPAHESTCYIKSSQERHFDKVHFVLESLEPYISF